MCSPTYNKTKPNQVVIFDLDHDRCFRHVLKYNQQLMFRYNNGFASLSMVALAGVTGVVVVQIATTKKRPNTKSWFLKDHDA